MAGRGSLDQKERERERLVQFPIGFYRLRKSSVLATEGEVAFTGPSQTNIVQVSSTWKNPWKPGEYSGERSDKNEFQRRKVSSGTR